MAIVPGTLLNTRFSDNDGGNGRTIVGNETGEPAFDDRSSTVTTGKGIDKRVGFRLGTNIRIFDIASFAPGSGLDLNVNMIAGTPVRLQYVFDSALLAVYKMEPVYFTVVPVFGELEDKCKLWIHDSGSGAPTSGYDDLGVIIGGSSPTLVAETIDDGCGRPLYVKTTLSWDVEIPTQAFSTIEAHTGDLKVAIDHGNSTFTTFDNVAFHTIPGINDLVNMVLSLSGSWRDVTAANGITIQGGFATPTAAKKYFEGFDFIGVASGVVRTDVLTIGNSLSS